MREMYGLCQVNMKLTQIHVCCKASIILGTIHFLMLGVGLAGMRGGPSQIQDSQRGGGGVINKSAFKEGGYLNFYFCFILKQILSVHSGMLHGLQAS